MMTSHSGLVVAALVLQAATFSDAFAEKYARMGVCEHHSTKERRCVMSAAECEPTHIDGTKNLKGELFVSVHQQELQNKVTDCACDNTPVYACVTPDLSDPSKESTRCVAEKSSCNLADGRSYIATGYGFSSQCTCEAKRDDYSDSVIAATTYGACAHSNDVSNYFCSYQATDCVAPFVYVDAEDVMSVLGTTCSCERVRTGGCTGGFTMYSNAVCTVTGDDCAGMGRWLAPLALKESHGESCRLCVPSANSALVPPDAVDATTKNHLSSLAIVVIVFASLFLAASAAWCIFTIKRRRSVNSFSGEKEQPDGIEKMPEVACHDVELDDKLPEIS